MRVTDSRRPFNSTVELVGPQSATAVLPRSAPDVSFQPLYDRVLVLPLDRPEETKGGLVIPQTAEETMKVGVVVSVGEGRVDERGEVRPLRTRPGDKVLFGLYAGAPIELGGKTFLVMREAEIFGKVL